MPRAPCSSVGPSVWRWALLVVLWPGLAWSFTGFAWDYTNGSTPAVQFGLYRQTKCLNAFTLVAAIDVQPAPPGTYQYRDLTALAGTLYCWQVTAFDAQGAQSTPTATLQYQLHRKQRRLRGW